MPNLVELVKQAAVEAMDAEKPAGIVFGTVVSAAPLEIQIDQKITLRRVNLVLARNVTDHDVRMTVSHRTESTQGGVDLTHAHDYAGTKTFRLHNGLKVGEQVLLMRMQGGKKFIVIDRLEG